MDKTIQKLFAILQDPGQQSFFNLALKQLVNIHASHPVLLLTILQSASFLMHSRAKEATTRLRHRQIFAALVERTLKNADQDVKVFLSDQEKDDIQYIFGLSVGQMIGSKVQGEEDQLQGIQVKEDLRVEEIDFERIMGKYSLGKGIKLQIDEKMQKKDQEEFFKKLKNVQLLSETSFIQQIVAQSQQPDAAQLQKKQKSRKKVKESYQKILKTIDQKQKQTKSKIVNVQSPFNTILEQALSSALNKDWQSRHSSMMLLKSFTTYELPWLAFNANDVSFMEWSQLRPQLKSLFIDWISTRKVETLARRIVALAMVVIAIDRFVDFQGERCNILVREVAGEIVARAVMRTGMFKALSQAEAHRICDIMFRDMMEYSRKVDSHESNSGWQTRLSILSVASKLLPQNPALAKTIKPQLLPSLATTQIDDITLHACQCLLTILETESLKTDFLAKVKEQLWQLLEQADDVSYSTTLVVRLAQRVGGEVKVGVLLGLAGSRVVAVRREVYKMIAGCVGEVPESQAERCVEMAGQKVLSQVNSELFQAACHLFRQAFKAIKSKPIKQKLSQKMLSYLDLVCTTDQLVKNHFRSYSKEPMKTFFNQPISILPDILDERAIRLSKVMPPSQYSPKTVSNHRRILFQLLSPSQQSYQTFTTQQLKDILSLEEQALQLPELQIYSGSIGQLVAQCQSKGLIGTTIDISARGYQKLYQALNGCPRQKCVVEAIGCIQGFIRRARVFLGNLKAAAASHYLSNHLTPSTKIQFLNLLVKPLMARCNDERLQQISIQSGRALSILLKHLNEADSAKKITKNLLAGMSEKYQREKGQACRKKGDDVRLFSRKCQAFRTVVEGMGCGWVQAAGVLSDLGKGELQRLRIILGILMVQQYGESYFGWLLKLAALIFQRPAKTKEPINDLNSLLLKIMLKLVLLNNKLQSNDKKNQQFYYKILDLFCKQMENGSQLAFKTFQKLTQKHQSQITPFLSNFVTITIKSLASPSQVIQSISMQALGDIMACQLVTAQSDMPRERDGREFSRILSNPRLFQTPAITMVEQAGFELRDYQKEGIKWMSFLVKYGLNGALCDEMGLGKTIQTLAVLNHTHQQQPNRCSLIICPPTLVYHWQSQQNHFFPTSPLQFVLLGQSIPKGSKNTVFLTSYSTIARRAQSHQSTPFLFIILDQGHAIRNPKTMVSKAVKTLNGQHRFLLSGTPIQNALIQLWSIFQFLMKGYLGDDDTFKKRFQNLFQVSIVNLQQDKLLFNQQQRQKLQTLHKKSAPFILRRTKTQVLTDIPPKVIQDYDCILTEQQLQLYTDLQNRDLNKSSKQNILTIMSKMQKIINHPSLASPDIPPHYHRSGKMLALYEILTSLQLDQDLNQNKVIVFSQSNAVLELIESGLLKAKFKGMRYLRLTSELNYQDRFLVAQRFNCEMDCRVLLVNSRIGSHGLNLSKATVVVMFDHSYNPCEDQQAMDRAHRIGQKKVLLVYRLIAKGTLQQKLMNYQRFKTLVANSVINLENSSISTLQDAGTVLTDVQQFMKQKKEVRDDADYGKYSKLLGELQHQMIDEEAYNNPFQQ